jgi:hypothetical protein
MADLGKMTDIEVIQHYFKVDEKTAQNLIDEGMNMDALRGKVDILKDIFTKEFNDITEKMKTELGKIVNDFDL